MIGGRFPQGTGVPISVVGVVTRRGDLAPAAQIQPAAVVGLAGHGNVRIRIGLSLLHRSMIMSR
jgi:hypothetical protein